MATFREFTTAAGQVRIEARVHRRGAAVVSKRFPSRREAEAWARKIEAQVDRGEQPATRAGWLVKDAVTSYLAANPLPSRQRAAFNAVALDLGQFAVGKLTRKMLSAWIDMLRKQPHRRGGTYADSTLRKFFYAAKSALEWHAREHNYALPGNLFADAAPAAWSGHRERRLAPGELERLLAAADAGGFDVPAASWADLIAVAVDSGMRSQEIILAHACDISPDNRILRVRPEIEKTRKGRLVPLGAVGREIIGRRRAGKENASRIFPEFWDTTVVSKGFARIAAAAGSTDLVFHDLRHEAITLLCLSGRYSLPEAMTITGHSSLATFQRYTVFFGDQLASKRD